ncbi:MAG: pseudaminic acid cytidylyltransferase [Myxococcota bacterium]
MTRAVAVIPARGGSKRIPRKNIREFAGRPIIEHSIAAARSVDAIERVVVTTDDAEIAEVARRAGAEVPFERPAELADDSSSTDAVLQHALRALRGEGSAFDVAVCLYATAPFVRPADLRGGLDVLRREGATSVISVAEYPSPIQRAMHIVDGRLEMVDPSTRLVRSQDLPKRWHDAGQFYVVDVDAYLEEGRLYSRHAVPFVLERQRAVDIDEMSDWVLAETMYRVLEG